jgi:acylphosphatase
MIQSIIQVRGLVQGVYFRVSTREAAKRLGLTGEVKNLPDGSVWIAAEGAAAVVAQLIEWCRKGPPGARVTSVTVTEGIFKGYTDFQVTR